MPTTSESDLIRHLGEANGWAVVFSDRTYQLSKGEETHTFAITDGIKPLIPFLLDQHIADFRVTRTTCTVVLKDGTTKVFPKTGGWWQPLFAWMGQLITPAGDTPTREALVMSRKAARSCP